MRLLIAPTTKVIYIHIYIFTYILTSLSCAPQLLNCAIKFPTKCKVQEAETVAVARSNVAWISLWYICTYVYVPIYVHKSEHLHQSYVSSVCFSNILFAITPSSLVKIQSQLCEAKNGDVQSSI